MAPGLMEHEAPDMESSLMLERLGLMTHCCVPTALCCYWGVDVMHHVIHLVRPVNLEQRTQKRVRGFQIKRKTRVVSKTAKLPKGKKNVLAKLQCFCTV